MKPSPAFASASWIASPIVGGPRTIPPVPFFRKSFQIDQPVRSAQLTITALGVYECEINGTRIGDEVFAPGWTEYRKRVQYQTYDVTSQIQVGENVLGAILGDGWFCGYVAWHTRQVYGDRPRLLARLEVTLQDGSTVNIVSDTSWKTSTGPILESDMLMGETYDARRELTGWSQPGYDQNLWQPVFLLPPDTDIELTPRTGPPVRRIEEIKAGAVTRSHQWSQIIDMGQNFTGRIRLRVKSAPGTTVKLRYAEVLNPNGTLYTDNLRSAKATEYYTTKGSEIETYEPHFTFHGFRYVDISGIKDDDFFEITGIVLHSDTKPTGSFSCSHPLLNQLQHNITWGQKSNFLEAPTDCPQRDERLGWTGDAQVFIRTAAFNMNVQGFFQKWVRDIREAQGPKGEIPAVVPHIAVGSLTDGGPAWADATMICPWTIYLCYGDSKILEDHYDSMKRYMGFLGKDRSIRFIRNHPDLSLGTDFGHNGFGDWLALDGGGKTEGITPHDLIGTAFHAYDADIMAKTAAVLGRKDDAAHYRTLHGEIVKAFQNRYVTPDGVVVAGTQTAYVLALHFGLLPENLRAAAAGELVRDIKNRNYHLATGFVGTPYLLEVLENAGYLDVAYRLLEQETFPSWLFPVKNGATTIWERWDGWTTEKGFQDKGMNSFNHYAYGAVGEWMYRTVAGLELDPNDPGYAHILFRPRPGGTITWAEAKLQTRFGETGIHWKLKGEALEVKLTVPSGARATFLPPTGYAASKSTYGEGTHQLTLKKA